MIKIIREGEKHFETKCFCCLCEFAYDLEDLNAYKYVKCPVCDANVPHENVEKYREYKKMLEKYKEELVMTTHLSQIQQQNDELFKRMLNI